MSTRGYPELKRLPLAGGEPRDLPAPPVWLEPDTFAARLYGMLAPLAQADPQAGWSLLTYVNSIGGMYELVEDWVRDTADGPGWSLLMDVDRCPVEALPWLGQFAGVRIPPGLLPDPADQRAWIRSTSGFRRGTRNAMIGAARATLTGARSVIFRERHHDPADTPDYAYYLFAGTYTRETPNPDATLRALIAAKPGGIVLEYKTINGQDYQNVLDVWLTYQAVKAGYYDYFGLLADEPR